MTNTRLVLAVTLPLLAALVLSQTVDFSEAQRSLEGLVLDIEENNRVEIVDSVSEEAPTLTLDKITKLRASTNKMDPITHTVHYTVASGTINLENIQVEVTSDVEQEDYSLSSLTSFKSSKNVARIKALDVDSITIEITGYSLVFPTGDPRGE